MEKTYDLAVIGAGPAGLAACIYGARNGLKLICLEKGVAGGQAAEAPLIENYPGFSSIEGLKLMDQLKQHALGWVKIREGEEVKGLEKDAYGRNRVTTEIGGYATKSVLICSGATPRKAEVEGEDTFFGKGVSYCATCDGFFFKGKEVLVIGGGNSAAMNAVYLSDLGCRVRLIHRRGELRAEQALQKQVFKRGIKVIWNSNVKAIKGNEKVKSVIIKNLKTNKIEELKVDGVFVSIGDRPNSELARSVGISLSKEGYILTDREQRTNIPGFYAAGDVTGGVKQIVVACAQGAIAALTVYKDLIKPYWA
jgi:thioredoxin reductase (NADPH)